METQAVLLIMFTKDESLFTDEARVIEYTRTAVKNFPKLK
jgi:hypothetical protein